VLVPADRQPLLEARLRALGFLRVPKILTTSFPEILATCR
jgi:hypothetical protein